MCEEFFDKKTDGIVYQEKMPTFESIELPGCNKFYATMLIGFILISSILFAFFIRDAFLYTYTLLGGVVFILITWLLDVRRIFSYKTRFDEFRIKYVVIDGRIIVSNIKTGTCIFNFRVSEISCIKAPFYKSKYFYGKHVMRRYIFGSKKRCLLISSLHDEYKQRIPIGYSEDMIVKLILLFSRYGVVVH
jgi:hypothetical protein